MRVENNNIGLPVRVMVVGELADEFVNQVAEMLDGRGVECVVCEDVYSAVGTLAKTKDGGFLVVGRLCELKKEQGRFFHIAGQRGCRYCFVVDGELVHEGEELMAAVQAGAFIAKGPTQVQDVVNKLLISDVSRQVMQDGTLDFIKDGCTVTEAEMKELLDFSS
jgi:hypothetical protein